jgi:hypothetical protein
MTEAGINRLVAMLQAETDALRAGELRKAADLAAAKTDHVREFVAAANQTPSTALAVPLDRLRRALADNREALQEALTLQSRVVETVAQAVTQVRAAATPGYGRGGRRDASLALSVRA